MKTTIDEEGQMTIAPETNLEAFALHKWCQENLNNGDGYCILFKRYVETESETNRD